MFTLADGRRRLCVFEDRPADKDAITVTEFKAAKIASPGVLSQNFRFGPLESATFSQKPLERVGNVEAFSEENAQVIMTLFRYFDEMGIPDAELGWLFELMRLRGNTIYAAMLDRALPMNAPFKEGEEYHYIEFLNDTPKPQEEMTGFMTADVKGLPQEWAFYRQIVADPVGG